MMRSLFVGLVLACACHSSTPGGTSGSGSGAEQSFRDGVQALCDLPDHVPDTGEPYDKRLAAAAAWATAHVTNPDAKKLGDIGSLSKSRDQLGAAVKKAGVTHCKLADNGMALQSFAEAMKLVCSAPSIHDAAYFKSHLLNPEVITLLGAIGDLNPADRAMRMRDAITKAGLTSCGLTDHMTSVPPNAPKVTGAGFIELDASAPVVVATPTGIVIEGKTILAIRDGAFDPSELEGGAMPRVREFMKAIAAAKPTPRVQLVVDPSLPYKLLVQLMFTIQQAGIAEFTIVVAVGDTAKAIPISMLTAKPGPGPGLRPVVAIAGPKLMLWSISGTEGTRKQPKLNAAGAAEIGKALAEIVGRRWPTAKRSDDDRRIVVMADAGTPMQTIAEVLAVVRATSDGKVLFPMIDVLTELE